MNTNEMEGKCLCGAVTIKTERSTCLEVCHCGMCLCWGSGPLMALPCKSAIHVSGDENVSTFNSSAWAERAFCKICGTHLFYRLTSTNQYLVLAGLFHDQSDFEITEQVFIDKKPSYYALVNKTPMLTEAEVIEKYSNL